MSAPAERESLRVVVAGHVDHGKSTLVGRLFHDAGALPEGKLESIRADCERRGMPFEWAFLTDALQSERDQGVTIDAAQIWFRTVRRDYVLVDAPGHREFLKNMITGASASDAALLLVDAAEGVREQSRRHGYLLQLLGVRQIAVVVNKMDLVRFSEARFADIERECRAYLKGLGVEAAACIPISARTGDNVASPSSSMPWYAGPTVVEALDGLRGRAVPADLPLRLPVQDVYKFDHRRIIVGRVESGCLRVGDTLVFSPSNRVARVASIESWNAAEPAQACEAGQSVGFVLDEPIFVERGEVASHLDGAPVESDVFRAKLFWLGREPLAIGAGYKMKLGTAEASAMVQSIERVIDTSDLSTKAAGAVERNAVAEVTLRVDRVLALDVHADGLPLGRFVLADDRDIAGGGVISMEGYADQRSLMTRRSANITPVEHAVSADARMQRNGHRGGVLWFTGLSGAGKSTLAIAAERRLFALGYQVFLLDGDNVRHGLCADLGFSPQDRAENIRRVGEVAALLGQAGFIALTAFISPYRSDRNRARQAAGVDFHEVYVKADLAVCEKRDPKGLYRRARAGEIEEFTGISAPYEAPESADCVIDTENTGLDACVEQILDYVRLNFGLATRLRAQSG
jgi:bifunctional enzyme CysN/CysC